MQKANAYDLRVRPSSELQDYLQSKPLKAVHYLTSNGSLSFHWANWRETALFQRHNLHQGAARKRQFRTLERELESLKEVPAWLRRGRRFIRSTLYDLYESYLDPRIRMTWFDCHEETLVSLTNEAGPYVALCSMRWFDRELFAGFVYRRILTRPMPLRSFRLGVNFPIVCRFDGSLVNTARAFAHQISHHGMVIKIVGSRDLERFYESKFVELDLPTLIFEDTKGMHGEALLKVFSETDMSVMRPDERSCYRVDSQVLHCSQNVTNLRLSSGPEYFIFLRHDDVKACHGRNTLKDLLTPTVDSISNHLDSELKK